MRIGIVGTGLIGASIGLAAREAGIEEVRGFDADESVLGLAAERGAVDPAGSLAEAVGDVELALVAAPVTILPSLVQEVLEASPDATVTDVGSTKGAVCAAVAD